MIPMARPSRITSIKMRLSTVGRLVALGALGCLVVPVSPAHGYVEAPYLACFNNGQGELASLEGSLSPAVNTVVPVGTPVTFSGNSGAPVTFAVASSAALLSSPDIDGGPGTLQPGTSSYTFTSTKATVTPGVLIYWDASFSDATLNGCESLTPTIYTTQVRTFTVVSPPPAETEAAAEKKQEEEAAAEAKKKQEEAATAVIPTGGVYLDGSTIAVQNNGKAQVKLACAGTDTCIGKLTLTARTKVKTKGKGKRRARTEAIGSAGFSVLWGTTATVKLALDPAGRALLGAAHGRLGTTLTILQSAPVPAQTHNEGVRLVGY
jgi:hypothetical protein